MANLAIKGHATRGKEVIEILEMLGGENTVCSGNNIYAVYSILNNGYIYPYQCEHKISPDNFIIFTLEEFLEKFPYKIGDKVCFSDAPNHYLTIKKIWWNEDCNDLECTFHEDAIDVPVKDLQPYKEEPTYKKYNVEEYLKVWEETEKGLEVVINDNFELKEDNGKFYIIKKQLQYPKTYEECCEVIGIDVSRKIIYEELPFYENITLYEENIKNQLEALRKLLICRDTYWKIAGEEMGLGKPWEPDWKSSKEEIKYGILYDGGEKHNSMTCTTSMVLVFPTAEMRDAFYENFKELIEECKELL